MAAFSHQGTCRVVLVASLLGHACASYAIDEDVHLDPVGLLGKYGYPGEAHEVTTEDGYILNLHRVPSSPLSPLQEGHKKPVVFLQHGLFCSSAVWVVMGPGAGLAYILADAGYDVWMGNARGNTYSRRHVEYCPDQNSKFWNFNFHEIGIYDMTASIDYVLKATEEEKLYYIGHSMGTTLFWVMNSMKPEYNKKFRAMFALAPEIYLSHMPNLLGKALSLINKSLEFISKLVGYHELLPSNSQTRILSSRICRDKLPTQSLCKNIVFLVNGYNPEELNSTMLPVIFSHVPAGTSMNTMLHFMQEVVSSQFQQWDYGPKNVLHYGSSTPPKYNVSKVTVPVALYYSLGDSLNAHQDVDRLYRELRNPIGKFKNPMDSFSHSDFLWGIHAKELLYDHVMSIMKRF